MNNGWINAAAIMLKRARIWSQQGIVVDLSGSSLDLRGLLVIHAPSGAGKSVLFRALCGYVPRGLGAEIQIWIDGKKEIEYRSELEREDFVPLRSLRYVAQSTANTFSPYRSLRLQIRDAGGRTSVPTDDLARMLGVEYLLADNAFSYEVSTGQTQRLSFLRAICSGGSILLCDEITSGLDPENERILLKVCGMITRKLGISFILSSHRPITGAGVQVYDLQSTQLVRREVGTNQTRKDAGDLIVDERIRTSAASLAEK